MNQKRDEIWNSVYPFWTCFKSKETKEHMHMTVPRSRSCSQITRDNCSCGRIPEAFSPLYTRVHVHPGWERYRYPYNTQSIPRFDTLWGLKASRNSAIRRATQPLSTQRSSTEQIALMCREQTGVHLTSSVII